MRSKLAIDIGGTFTDVVFRDPSGAVTTAKVPTTPHRIAEGILAGMERAGAVPSAVDVFVHGTTIAINALLEGKTAPTALVTTAGFRDVLEIMRTNRAHMYDLLQEKPTPLVPRRLRLEVSARMRHDGTVLRELEPQDLRQIADTLRDADVASVAVCLLHAYANPRHEHEVGAALGKLLPGVAVSLSSDLTREWREFERTSTTVVNAATMPVMAEYLADLSDELSRARFAGRLLIMQSNGGVTAASDARARPVASLMSGPAGAVAGAVALARVGGPTANLVTLDIGGTSADVAVVDRGEPTVRADAEIEGWPISVPSIDIATIGAGGGSLARVDAFGALSVGPESAGAAPGPACYGRGGTEATVTDAHVVLGRIAPRQVLGGAITVDGEAARRAVTASVATPLSMSVEEAAAGIVTVVNSNMTRVLWEMIIGRGRDPRDFTLLALGGGGGLHACELADGLGVSRVMVPRDPGAFSAHGMLSATSRHDFTQTIGAGIASDPGSIEAAFASLVQLAHARRAEHETGDQNVELQRMVELRYRGQRRGIPVEISPDLRGHAMIESARAAFEREHESLFGFRRAGRPIEIVRLQLTMIGAPSAADPVALQPGPSSPPDVTHRAVQDGGTRHNAAVYHRDQLPVSFAADGPCVVEEMTATTYVPPGWGLRVLADGTLQLSKSAASIGA